VLNPQRAQKELEALKVPDPEARRLARVAALPSGLRRIGYGLLDRLPNGNEPEDYRASQRLLEDAIAQLDASSAREREAVFGALFPRISRAVEQAWRLFFRLPYQSGYLRRAFRAPGLPAAQRAALCDWLRVLPYAVGDFEQGIDWFVAWAPYIAPYNTDTFGVLFAAVIDAGGPDGEAAFETLLASARGEHPVGAMGRHVTRALLCASRRDGWEFIERLLLAAQRQEGLRQTVLETIDEAHPEAFRRMLRLIRDHDLLRFSATVRGADVWFGLQFETMAPAVARGVLDRARAFLEAPGSAVERASQADGGTETLYLALWSIAFEDALAAVAPAARLLSDPDPERRFAAAYLLGQLNLSPAAEALLPALDDEDLRIAATAFQAIVPWLEDPALASGDLFERLERLLARCPRKKTALSAIVWPWMTPEIDLPAIAGALVRLLGKRSPKRLIPYLSRMDPWGRAELPPLLARLRRSDTESRDALLSLVGDANVTVRERALEALAGYRVSAEDAVRLERMLTRKSGDVRCAVLGLLRNQEDPAALASADRLLAARDPQQRAGGLELLQQLVEAGRAVPECRARAERFRAAGAGQSGAAEQLLETLCEEPRAAPTLENALGLMDPAQRTPPGAPRAIRGVTLGTDAARRLLRALDDVIHEHRETPAKVRLWDESEREELLGNIQWGFPAPRPEIICGEDAARLPLREVWEEWWAVLPASVRDADGFHLLRAMRRLRAEGEPRLQYPQLLDLLLKWLLRLHPPAGAADFLLDAVETSFAHIPASVIRRRPPPDRYWEEWRNEERWVGWLSLAREHRSYYPSEWTTSHHARLWPLLRWLDEPGPAPLRSRLWGLVSVAPQVEKPLPRERPLLEEALVAWDASAATEADLYDMLLGPREEPGSYSFQGGDFSQLRELTRHRGSPLFEQYPGLCEIVAHCRERIVAIELRRGDVPTAASWPALALRYSGEMETLVRLLQAFGSGGFARGWGTTYSTERASVFSHLIRSTFPGEEETLEAFARRARAAGIGEKRLVDLAFYAPQWAAHVEQALGWPEFAEAVWWIHAHTKDTQWSVDEEIRAAWAAQVSERTPLTATSLIDGAVDVDWFHRVHSALGAERWRELDESAKYGSGGGGHKRAHLFADAMLGAVSREALLRQVRDKRNQDALRAIGLLPLAEGAAREAEILERYELIQEFLRGSRQFGSQRQASEKLAASISMENLARTGGYPDPIRLEWAMEARAVADLAGGPLVAKVPGVTGEVTVALSINPWGEANVSVTKAGRLLKAVPPAVRKDPAVGALLERKREVERQAARMRASLEQAMCRSERFTGTELGALAAHPVLAPMLRNLVFVGERKVGYPIEEGRSLEAHDGRVGAVAGEESVRLAHPHDLARMGEWHLWQRDCFRRERVQPFKQVFRELYVLTAAEQGKVNRSLRYTGHQVNPRQALALLGKRGWVANAEEGAVRRTFHDQQLTAWLEFDYGFLTPAEVEGLTVESVAFSRRGEGKRLALSEIPPPLFSEVMRDVDLVVSVAHRGGVDPEATASTLEMRAALLRETCGLLGLDNVRLRESHALVNGELGSYSVHLGSAMVHRQPGGHLCIVPVHSQHRGRLFLPFFDDDPKTAEVVSKVLLLAKDKEIKAPSILEQILAKG
jgi:HEAT repeat protein